jgi:hypothetical protein
VKTDGNIPNANKRIARCIKIPYSRYVRSYCTLILSTKPNSILFMKYKLMKLHSNMETLIARIHQIFPFANIPYIIRNSPTKFDVSGTLMFARTNRSSAYDKAGMLYIKPL